jgi:hypothetical protein
MVRNNKVPPSNMSRLVSAGINSQPARSERRRRTVTPTCIPHREYTSHDASHKSIRTPVALISYILREAWNREYLRVHRPASLPLPLPLTGNMARPTPYTTWRALAASCVANRSETSPFLHCRPLRSDCVVKAVRLSLFAVKLLRWRCVLHASEPTSLTSLVRRVMQLSAQPWTRNGCVVIEIRNPGSVVV